MADLLGQIKNEATLVDFENLVMYALTLEAEPQLKEVNGDPRISVISKSTGKEYTKLELKALVSAPGHFPRVITLAEVLEEGKIQESDPRLMEMAVKLVSKISSKLGLPTCDVTEMVGRALYAFRLDYNWHFFGTEAEAKDALEKTIKDATDAVSAVNSDK